MNGCLPRSRRSLAMTDKYKSVLLQIKASGGATLVALGEAILILCAVKTAPPICKND